MLAEEGDAPKEDVDVVKVDNVAPDDVSNVAVYNGDVKEVLADEVEVFENETDVDDLKMWKWTWGLWKNCRLTMRRYLKKMQRGRRQCGRRAG